MSLEKLENHNGYCAFARDTGGRRLTVNYVEEGGEIRCHVGRFLDNEGIQDCVYGGEFGSCKKERVGEALLKYIKAGDKLSLLNGWAKAENGK